MSKGTKYYFMLLQIMSKKANFGYMTTPCDTYRSIASPSRGTYRELGSRFIALAYPVESEEEAKAIIESVRKEYHDARHHCYAYRLGLSGATYRSNDDGEPSSSAGRPILGQIDSAGLSDVLVVVVRYFGGVKLGIPGLIRAYKTAAREAIDAAQVIGKTAGRDYRLTFGYLSANEVMKTVKDMSLQVLSQSFDLHCSMVLRVRLSAEDDFCEKISRIRGCEVQIINSN